MPHGRLDAIWQTEWAIAKAGATIARRGACALAWSCAFADLPASHQAFVDEGQEDDARAALFPLPCEHRYQIVARAPLPSSRGRELWAMWRSGAAPTASDVELVAISGDEQWAEMRAYREETERPLGARHVEQIRARARELDSSWFLAVDGGEVVGGAGIVRVETPLGCVARLQDIEIRRSRRGRGLGTRLLGSLVVEARAGAGVCLLADADDWPRLWYERHGFVRLGSFHRAPLGGW